MDIRKGKHSDATLGRLQQQNPSAICIIMISTTAQHPQPTRADSPHHLVPCFTKTRTLTGERGPAPLGVPKQQLCVRPQLITRRSPRQLNRVQMAVVAMSATCTAPHPAPSTSLRLSGEGVGLRSAFAASQCSCGRATSSAFFGAPILRVERPSRTLRLQGPVQPSAVKYEYKSSQNASDLSQAPLSSNSNLSLIKDAKIEAQPPQDQKLRLRVDLSGKDTQKAFDTVVRSLAKNAPPVPGFRKAKGGKTSIVPTSVLLNMMGVQRVRKFVIEEMVRTVLVEYVEKEGIKAKKNLATDKTADELNAIFEPGQDFGFDATLDLEEDSGDAEAKPEAATSESEVVSA